MTLIIGGILFSYLHLAWLATTDILRLLRGSNTKLFDPRCYCSECRHSIALRHQLPIISYTLNRGKCPYCKRKIEPLNFYLEIALFALYLVLMIAFNFKPLGVLISFLAYEAIKIAFIAEKGHKEEKFFREYILSILANVFVFSLIGFMSILLNYISSGNILR